VSNKLRAVVTTSFVVTVAAGAALAGAPLDVPPACAACAGVLPQCQQGDSTLTSRLDVSHTTEAFTLPVEPEDLVFVTEDRAPQPYGVGVPGCDSISVFDLVSGRRLSAGETHPSPGRLTVTCLPAANT